MSRDETPIRCGATGCLTAICACPNCKLLARRAVERERASLHREPAALVGKSSDVVRELVRRELEKDEEPGA